MSYANTIANAVVAVIEGLATPPAQTEFRKVDTLTRSDKDLASNVLCVVTLSDEQQTLFETFGDDSDLGTIGKAYMVGVSLYKLHAGNIQTNNDTLPAMALRIEQALNQPTLAGATTVFGSKIIPFQTFSIQAFSDGYECMRGFAVYTSAEPRNG
jgi:hypothetical protein